MLSHDRLATARKLLDLSRHTRRDAHRAAISSSPWGSLVQNGAIHECFGDCDESPCPLAFVFSFAVDIKAPIMWIGACVWPFASALARGSSAWHRLSVFVSPSRREERIWAIDCALRCPGVGVVVANASGLTMPESRRLQLAAEAGGTLGLLLRPPRELASLSVARTRWRLRPLSTHTTDPHWTLELLRCKGMRPATEDARRWVVHHSHATSHVHLVPDAAGRAAPASMQTQRLAV